MSIPPLVCSTPPPLEQCDDDRDAEDFDLQYNLSHYDDDDIHDYNYGSFNSYNNLESSSPEKTVDVEFSKQTNDVKVIEDVETKDNVESSECIGSDKNEVNTEEEINVEDLDLKLVPEEPPDIKEVPADSLENKCDVNSNNVDIDVASIPNSLHKIDVSHCIDKSPISDDIDVSKNDTEILGTTIQDTMSSEINSDQIDHNIIRDNEEPIDNSNEYNTEEKIDMSNVVIHKQDIDDFDDFQFINSDNNYSVNNAPKAMTEVLVTQESPWGNEESTNSDFGDFTANFEESTSQIQTEEIKVGNTKKDIPNTVSEEDDDDFGDFDDFKSSALISKNNEICQETPQVPVLNLQSTPENEKQVMETINKLLSSIFREEALESEESVEVSLDAVLNETWGHLMETDVRQPYIVNWNNSLAQKTLLKALCIDSRNILFGPKWSYNMPKYAANLTMAPLQPLKQPSTPNAAQNDTSNPDKAAAKPAAWTDPFATNGQESCSNEVDNAVIEPRPTDLDVFEAAMSTKKDKIYSSTISVQPIRQINLPDTHIFTPTDSETPRSKTIHYDCSPAPTVLMPQPVMDAFKIDETKPVTPSVSNTTLSNTDTDSEYWEFQDFKGTENTHPPLESKETANNSFPKTNITYQTQMLQPIKLEPIIPTLNWPDPGEIKETFEDFSDFVANHSSSGKTVVLEEQNKVLNVDITKSKSIELDAKDESLKSSDSFDDEFDTFQSALPPPKQNTSLDFNLSGLENAESNKVEKQSIPHENTAEFNCVFPNNSKSDDISFTNFNKPLDALPQAIDKINPKVPAASGVNNVTNSSILQPTPTGVVGQIATNSGVTLQNHQKSGQILQPLSLESYSQINWPNPGIDLQDLSRFNPVETLPSLKSDSSASHSKVGTPVHNQKSVVNSQAADDDIWGEFVSSNPKQPQSMAKNTPALIDDDEWTDFVSSSSVKPPNGLNTISFNVHTNSNMQKSANQSKFVKNNQLPLDIPSLNYITPKTGNHKSYNDKHFQNL